MRVKFHNLGRVLEIPKLVYCQSTYVGDFEKIECTVFRRIRTQNQQGITLNAENSGPYAKPFVNFKIFILRNILGRV